MDVEWVVSIETHVFDSAVDDFVRLFVVVHLSSFFQPRLFGSQDVEIVPGIDRFLLENEYFHRKKGGCPTFSHPTGGVPFG